MAKSNKDNVRSRSVGESTHDLAKLLAKQRKLRCDTGEVDVTTAETNIKSVKSQIHSDEGDGVTVCVQQSDSVGKLGVGRHVARIGSMNHRGDRFAGATEFREFQRDPFSSFKCDESIRVTPIGWLAARITGCRLNADRNRRANIEVEDSRLGRDSCRATGR